jgi:hypothetical protein
MRTIFAVYLLLKRWVLELWDFFVRWFLPPPFPPDPVEDDDYDQHRRERQQRLGWIENEPDPSPTAGEIGYPGVFQNENEDPPPPIIPPTTDPAPAAAQCAPSPSQDGLPLEQPEPEPFPTITIRPPEGQTHPRE